MLRLRQEIEQARERPLLRFVVIVALAVLLVFTVGHVALDLAHDGGSSEFAAAVCVAIVFTLGLLRVRPQVPTFATPARAVASARPPDTPAAIPVPTLEFTPLRR